MEFQLGYKCLPFTKNRRKECDRNIGGDRVKEREGFRDAKVQKGNRGRAQLSWLCGTSCWCCSCHGHVWICCSFTVSSLCSMEAQLRTLTLCQVSLAASSFLSLGLPKSLAQRGTCFSIPKEKLGTFCFTHPITRRPNMESRFLGGGIGSVTEFISMYK